VNSSFGEGGRAMTRRRKLRVLAVLYAVGAVTLVAVSGWQVVEALRASPAEGAPWRPILSLGLAAVFVLPAWGLWHDTRWGWASAMLLACLVLAVSASGAAGPVVLCLVALLLLHDTAPKPLPSGPTAEQDADRVAAALGVRWGDTPLARIDELVRAGEADAAAKLYREAAGVSWDAARAAVARWEENAVERKLRLLARHLETPDGAEAGGATADGPSAEPSAADVT
jgi:hypothetical protein